MENIKTFYNSDKSLAYVRIEFVHEDDFNYLDQCIDAYEIIDCDFKEGPKKLLKELKTFEDKRKYNYKEIDKRWIYGMWFEILLPLGEIDLKTKKRLTRNFVNGLRSEEHLNYFAFETVRGKGRYINIFMSEREWYKHQRLYYKRDYWHDSLTGASRKKGDEGAVRTVKKGDFKEDVYNTFTTNKSRIFRGQKNVLEKRWLEIRQIWSDVLANAGLIFKSKWIFTRKKYNQHSNRFKKLNRQKINWLMTETENILARAYENEITFNPTLKEIKWGLYDDLRFADDDEILNDPFAYGFKTGEAFKELTRLFWKMENRFKKESFHYRNIEYKLHGTPTDVDIAINRLKEVFKEEFLMCFGHLNLAN